jgi:isoleucyl-tRNA synthetase
LLQEGLAREFIRQVQELRKQARFQVSDRIRLYYHAPSLVEGAVEAHRAYIMEQTLAVELKSGLPEQVLGQIALRIGGEEVSLGVTPA